jgi:hypothetical protein
VFYETRENHKDKESKDTEVGDSLAYYSWPETATQTGYREWSTVMIQQPITALLL